MIRNKTIHMIKCPKCGGAICTNIGIDCPTECKDNDISKCLQQKVHGCECKYSDVRKAFIENYNIKNEASVKNMIFLVSLGLVSKKDKMKILSDKDFML